MEICVNINGRTRKTINEKLGITVVMITHQMSVVKAICRHVAILSNGSVAEKGEVGEIFSSPKTDAAKLLVFSERLAEDMSKKNEAYLSEELEAEAECNA